MEALLKLALLYLAVVPDPVSKIQSAWWEFEYLAMNVTFGFSSISLLPEHLGL